MKSSLFLVVTVLVLFSVLGFGFVMFNSRTGNAVLDHIEAQPDSAEYVNLDDPSYAGMQQQFYYSTPPCYQPGISINIGNGFWYTPGFDFVFNFGLYDPIRRPFPSHCHVFSEPFHGHDGFHGPHDGFHGPGHDVPHHDPGHNPPHHEEPIHHGNEPPHHEPGHNPSPPHNEPHHPQPPHNGGGGSHGGNNVPHGGGAGGGSHGGGSGGGHHR